MCLRPIKIRNPAKSIALCGGAPVYMEVPCGNCAECKDNKRKEWNFRTWHEVNDCIMRGGYVYYVTLTYANEHLPHLSDFVDIKKHNIKDFSCFNTDHWRNFLKLVRIRLQRMYNGATLKYFLTSEYGTDDRFTHRPHYHLLLFVFPNDVENNALDPYTFSELVSECWPYGLTDGLPYKDRPYVAEHVFGYDLGQENAFDFMKATHYVSKYITKDSTFQKEIDKRVALLRKYYDDEYLKPIIRNIDMFHRQSQGFGISYINNLSFKERAYIFKNGACRLYKADEVVSVITLPLYYERKLFYKCIKQADKYIWQPTQYGEEYLYNKLLRNVDLQVKRIMEHLYNCKDVDYNYINKLLKGRTFVDFVIYRQFYKGRFYLTDKQVDNSTVHEWLNNIIKSKSYLKLSYYEKTSIDDDYNYIVCSDHSSFFETNSQTYNYDNFCKQHSINSNSFACFRGYDELDAYLKGLSVDDNVQKQSTFDYFEDITKKFKILYYGQS